MIAEEPPRPAAPAAPAVAGPDPRQALVQAGVQLLEALAGLVGGAAPAPPGNGQAGPGVLDAFVTTDARTGQPVLQLPLPPPEVRARGAAALQTILQALAQSASPGNGEPPPI